MKTKHFLSTSILLVTILAFVYFAQPIYAKANSGEMDYVTTSMSSGEVAQLFSGVEAFVPAAIIIIGFIVMMYCTLRNIDTPIDFSGQQSFIDKCQSLGQFMINNISDDVKDFFYSVYTYCQENNITSVTGMATFVAKNAAMFFGAIAKWIGGSLLNNRSQNGTNLLNQFADTVSFNLPTSSIDVSLFNNYSSIPLSSCLAFTRYRQYYYTYCLAFYYTGNIPNDVVCLTFSDGFGFYRLVNGVYTYATDITNAFLCSGEFSLTNPTTVNWTTSLTTVSFTMYQYYFRWTGSNPYTFLSTYGMLLEQFVAQFGSLFVVEGSVRDNINAADVTKSKTMEDVINPAADTYYGSSDDQVAIDVVGVAGALGALAALKSQGKTITAIDKIQAYVGDIGLTLESAIPQDVVVDNAGNYHFPNLDGIWKYPRYFFEMLKGWGSFVGGCLNAVTVGEGGLSWIFYGGFIILICGGVVGKIILG